MGKMIGACFAQHEFRPTSEKKVESKSRFPSTAGTLSISPVAVRATASAGMTDLQSQEI
jgi:hypothetical protein